jgi:antitoxin HicB
VVSQKDGLFKIRVHLEPQPEGGWTITSPDIPELITEADTPEEIEANVRDAFRVVLEIYEDRGSSVPESLRSPAGSGITLETLVLAG